MCVLLEMMHLMMVDVINDSTLVRYRRQGLAFIRVARSGCTRKNGLIGPDYINKGGPGILGRGSSLSLMLMDILPSQHRRTYVRTLTYVTGRPPRSKDAALYAPWPIKCRRCCRSKIYRALLQAEF